MSLFTTSTQRCLFMFRSIADAPGTVITADSEAPGLPVGNVANASRGVPYRSGPAGEARIDVTLPASDPDVMQGLAFVDHNLTSAGSIRMRAWSDAIDGADMVYDETIRPLAALGGFGQGGFGQGGFGSNPISLDNAGGRVVSVHVLPNVSEVAAARYWSITLAESSTEYQQLGRLMMGRVFRPRVTVQRGWPLSIDDITPSITTPTGVRYGPDEPVLAVSTQLSFRHLTSAERDELWRQTLRLGQQVPFVVQVRPGDGLAQVHSAIYGRFSNPEAARRNGLFNQFTTSVREAL